MTWLGHLCVPPQFGQDLISYTQPTISILDFIEALTFSFSDPWGSPKTSVILPFHAAELGQPGQSGSLPSLGGREWKDYRGSDPEAVSLPPSHLDLVTIQEELLALVKAATTRGGHVPGRHAHLRLNRTVDFHHTAGSLVPSWKRIEAGVYSRSSRYRDP